MTSSPQTPNTDRTPSLPAMSPSAECQPWAADVLALPSPATAHWSRRRVARTPVAGLAVGLLALGLAGCGSGSAPGAAPVTGPPSGTTSSTAATGAGVTSAPPSSSTTTSSTPGSPSETTAAAARPRTAAALTKALLQLDDLPAGWSVEPSGADDGSSVSMSSPLAACRDFVALGNASAAPGSRAQATTSFSAGQDGPFIDEGIDAVASRSAATTLLARVAAANTSCRSVSVAIPGAGRSTFSVSVVSPPRAGDHPVAVRLTAQGGDLDGLELTQVLTGVDDTVLGLTFVGAAPDDVATATEAAVDKAGDALGSRSSGV